MQRHLNAAHPFLEFHEHNPEGRGPCVASVEIGVSLVIVSLAWVRSPRTFDELYVFDWVSGLQIMVC